MDGSSESLDIGRCDTCDRYSAILGCIHGVLHDISSIDLAVSADVKTHLLSQLVHLLRSQTGIREHANLAGDMAPIVLRSQSFKLLLQKSAHVDDAVSHALDLAQPLLIEGRVVEYLRGYTGTVDRRVRVERADKDLDLRVHALLLLCICADNGEGTNTLTIESLVYVSS